MYNIAYAGTDGIVSAAVTFSFADITQNDLPFTQTFITSYYQVGRLLTLCMPQDKALNIL